ncbi:L,D-transpeptidase [Pseudomonas schmalbachii]|uniref:L,D-transpeptidase n=1 Tax=Pseudomonas schmalbachii TaxID=2816993 RepID=A0ABS3TUH0_9PSED|nr:L,D-transpeptidase [Pseudomonas schmalbachii]MBO3277299.1 L,D-transpeptidase [Pseudomonas schmalbachii]
MKRLLTALAFGLAASLAVASPNKASPLSDLRKAVKSLKPGQYLWYPEISPQGPVTLVVSLTEQRVFVYRNGIAIGIATVSTGKKGKDTPTGVFTILQKKVEYRSNLYNDAPMPYMQRLTWDGIALHAGNLPGYPASHGCIRLPLAFAKKLYAVTGFSSTTVIISDATSSPVEVYHPGLLAPTVSDGRPGGPHTSPIEPFWSDPGAEQGPLSVLISRADHRAYVYRGGIQIGSAPVAFDNPQEKTGVAAFSLLQKPGPEQIDSDNPVLRWTTVQVSNPEHGLSPAEQLGKFSMDRQFLRSLLMAMDIGSTLVITDLPSIREMRSNPDFTVISTNNRPVTQETVKNQAAD